MWLRVVTIVLVLVLMAPALATLSDLENLMTQQEELVLSLAQEVEAKSLLDPKPAPQTEPGPESAQYQPATAETQVRASAHVTRSRDRSHPQL